MSHHHHHVRPLRTDYGTTVAAPPRVPTRQRLPGQPTTLLEDALALANRPPEPEPKIKPLDFAARSANELRPATFAQMVGQDRLRSLLERLVANARATRRPLDAMLLIGSAGTGKTTVATVMAHELGTDVYVLQAPVTQETLEEVAKVARDRDVVFIDEIHLQSRPAERRGVSATPGSEVFLSILEDKRLTTATGMVPFPDVSFIGATTDSGLLPSPFLMRWPLQPRLDPYTTDEMASLAEANASSLGLGIDHEGALVFARASRATPRIVNRYCRNARSLAAAHVDRAVAEEVVLDLNSTTLDGLTLDMVRMLRFLLSSARVTRGETVYQASIGSIATALGKSRDQKIVALEVEPVLIERGLVGVGHGGRLLTPRGIERARQL